MDLRKNKPNINKGKIGESQRKWLMHILAQRQIGERIKKIDRIDVLGKVMEQEYFLAWFYKAIM